MTTPEPERGYLDTSLEARRRAATLTTHANRVNALLGRHWTTPVSLEEAERLLLEIAEEAILLRRVLCSR